MPFDKFEDAQAIDNERRKTIAKSIRSISVEELNKLGEEIFDSPDRPWRETFLRLITQNPGATAEAKTGFSSPLQQIYQN